MKRFVEGEDRLQGVLLPEFLDDYVAEDNLVRVLEVFVDELDLRALGFEGVVPKATGRPAYHPATLLKIYLYGYLNRIQSSRRLERETRRNIELMWLPDEPYAFAVWKRCRVAPDYHVEVDGHWYSAPFRLIKELVDVRVADRTVEIFLKGQRVASHARAPNRRGHTTIAEHMPSAHRRHAAWTPARIVAYAEKIGPSTAALCEAIMIARPHPEQGFRTCLGILALTRIYGQARVDAACRRGVSIKARSVASIRSILKNGLDRAFLDEAERSNRQPLRHGNIRGRGYFH